MIIRGPKKELPDHTANIILGTLSLVVLILIFG